nr:MAG TPA: Intermediate filament protein [Caudoviricetes sp.]
MSINVKKYTKDQMAKMVEDAQEKTAALEAESAALKDCIDKKNDLLAEYANLKAAMQRKNAALTEQLDQMKGEAITRENVIANLKADADALRVQLKNANDTMEAVSKELQRVNSENDGLQNKLTDTEAALGRANACIATMKVERDQQTKDCFEWQRSAQALHDDLLNARDRANYAENHPWRNLWAWIKRKLARHE